MCQKAHPDLKAQQIRVNPVVRGLCHYFKYGSSSATFGYLNHYLWWRAARWPLRSTTVGAGTGNIPNGTRGGCPASR